MMSAESSAVSSSKKGGVTRLINARATICGSSSRVRS